MRWWIVGAAVLLLVVLTSFGIGATIGHFIGIF